MLRRPRPRRSYRPGVDPSMRPLPGDLAVAMTASTLTVILTFSQPTVQNGIPRLVVSGGTHGAGELPTSCTKTSPTSYVLLYASAIIATNVGTYPQHDPAIRSQVGGYVAPTVKTF